MPKMRTRKSAAKRLEFTGGGKVKYRSGYYSHLLTRKSPKRKRRLQMAKFVGSEFMTAARVMLPYG